MTTMMSHHFKLPPTAAATATTAAAAAVVAGGGGGSGVATHVVATPLSSSAPATAAGAAAAGLLATAAAATVSSTTAAGASHTATAATHTGPQGTTTTYSAFLAAATMNHLHHHQPAESDELAAVVAAAAANFAAGEAATDVENATPASITHRRKCQQLSADAGDDAGAAAAAAAGAAMGDSDDAAMMMIKANNNNSGSEEQQDSALDTNSGGSRSDDGGVPPDDAAVATAPAADSDPAALPPLSAATPTGGEEPAYVSSKLADEHRAANALLAQNPHLADAVRDVFTKLGCSAMPCETADEDQYWRDVVGHFVRNNAQRDAGHDDMDPFYVVDLGRVVMQMAKFRRHLPGVHPYYAIKCNPSDFLLKMIAALGGNFDCASSAELKQVIEGGFATPDGVIFANPCKSVSDLKKAEAMGVRYVTFDNPAELAKIAEHMPSAKAVLRIKTADTAARCAFSTKFGASMSDVPMLLQTALELGVRIVGVSFHVGSGNNDPHAYVGSVENARRVFDDAEALGFDMKLLDLGGGFPGTDAPVNELTGKPDALNFEDIAAALRPVLASLFPTARVIAEPGRYFTAATHTLAMNVHSMRKVPLPTGFTAPGAHVPAPSAPSSRLTASALAAAASTPPEALPQSLSNDWMLGGAAALPPPPLFEYQYYVNDGLYHSFNCIVFDHARPQLNLLNPDSESRLHVSTMFGPTCDSLDCILKRQLFPELCIGDWLFVRSMGSYTTAAGAPFNGFATRRIEYVSSLPMEFAM